MVGLFPKVKKIKCPCCGEELVAELDTFDPETFRTVEGVYVSMTKLQSIKDYIDSKKDVLKGILLVDDTKLEDRVKQEKVPQGIWERVVGKGIEQHDYFGDK